MTKKKEHDHDHRTADRPLRARCARPEDEGDLEQPRQRQHHRVQEGPRQFRDADVPVGAIPGDPSGADAQYAVGLGSGTGVRVAGSERIHTQGSLTQTDNALDLAIEGSGFFEVTQADGTTAYTRDGSFKLNAEGQLVTGSGDRLNPAIAIPDGAQQIVIATDGTVSATLQGATTATQVGTIQIARFLNPAGLQPIGGNLYTATTASGVAQVGTAGADGSGVIRQGSLEASNVSTVQELVDMIETQRAYEVNAKVINAADEMAKYVTQNM